MDEYTTATELNQLAGAGAASWIALDAGGFSVTGKIEAVNIQSHPARGNGFPVLLRILELLRAG
jgi:hypothetical protein